MPNDNTANCKHLKKGAEIAPFLKPIKAMKRKVTIVLAHIAIVAVCYWLTFYVNPILGFIAVGIAAYTLAKVSMKGVE